MTNNLYRKLSQEEITIMQSHNCWADDWNNINVKDKFNPNSYNIVRFSGDIYLGATSSKIELEAGISIGTGIFNAKIHNCSVGDDSYISNVNQHIANYDIGNKVVISNIDKIQVVGETTFGNGTKVSVLNETGGRDVVIYDNMSSHVAYLLAMYRNDSVLIERLESMIADYVATVKSTRGTIGNNVNISNTRIIENTKIGNGAQICGASRLVNGSVNSTDIAKVVIGDYVIAKDFIISSATKIIDGAIIDKTFVGQGCEMGKQYSAENSLFFANCVGMHGEACSIFAGPYTVTHHKSTLLIAAMYSFMNAGSGSNQSNHMYKLGPIHQGVVDRGSKTTSDSYILWPSKIGAFSLIMGRHYNNCNTSIFPFSYLIENTNKSYLVPGVNLKSVGTIRDAKKWPTRDKRKGEKIDQINFNLLSPYTIGKMADGYHKLKTLLSTSDILVDSYVYDNCIIAKSALVKGMEYYEMAIYKFVGNSIIHKLSSVDCSSVEEVLSALKPEGNIGGGSWVDISGLLTPKSEITKIIEDIKENEVASLDKLHQRFVDINGNYYSYEWNWLYYLVKRYYKGFDSFSIQELIHIIKKWLKSVVELDELLYEDAKKEFTLSSKTGFGIDGSASAKDKDFENVRGEFHNNSFVLEVLHHIEKKTELGKSTISKLKNLL